MEITTKRLVLRPWVESDAERLYELAKDPEVGPAAGWFPHTDAEDSRRVIREILSAPGTYAVVLKESDKVIGSFGVFGTAAAGVEGEPEIGYWIGRDYWGHEYAPEAVRALLGLCFAGGNKRVWCAYFEGNEKSRRCMEKCGFCYHHTEEDVLWRPTGETKTEHYTCITREEWDNRRKAEQAMKHDVVEAIIEIPCRSRNKYEVDKETGRVRLDRVLYSAMGYPAEYGYLENTLAPDGDPLDILVVGTEPTYPGCVVPARVIGYLTMIDGGSLDYKLISVVDCDPRYDRAQELRDLPPFLLDEIRDFFENYKRLQKIEVVVKDYHSKAEALALIEETRRAYADEH